MESTFEGDKSKLLIVSDRVTPFYTGGYETVFLNYSRELFKEYEITWLTGISNQYSDIIKTGVFVDAKTNAKFSIIPMKGLVGKTNWRGNHSLFGILSLFFELRKHYKLLTGYQIVLINSIPYFGLSNIIKHIKRQNSLVIVVFHEAWYNYPTGLLSLITKNLIRIVIKKLSMLSPIIADSKATRESLVDNYKVNERDVELIPLGVELPSDNYTNNFDLDEREIDIAFIGRIARIKRVIDIIEAANILIGDGIQINIIIAGDGPLKEKLIKHTFKKGLEKIVKFTGHINEIDKKNLLSKTKLFVMPSEREGFSLVTLEAMSMGVIPIVAIPAFPELFGIGQYLSEGYNGATYPAGNVKELAEKVKTLLSDKNNMKRLASNAIRTSVEYTWKATGLKLREYLMEKAKTS